MLGSLGRWRIGLWVCTFILSAKPVGADSRSAWELSRFIAEGNKVNEAAARVRVTAGTDVVVLDEEDSYAFDGSGKSVYTHYVVYKVLTQGGTQGWDAVAINWEPWHQERPTVRARVITPDNAVHVLDSKTITDAPAQDEDEKTYGDGRVLRAPLPAIAPGSVVEEEDVLKENAPLFGPGVVARDYFGKYVPVQQAKLTLEAPASLPLRYSLQKFPDMKPQKTESNGRVQIVFESGPMEALEQAESYLPKDVPAQPLVTFSTGASWQEIAKGYAEIVDKKANVNDVQPLVSKLVSGKTTREQKAAAVVQYLSREIRYTGVEFGDAAIIPHVPSETLKHKYGDCKDKATLAVSMLRAAGVPAYVALLNAGGRYDVDAELPGMGMFDHAIVYAPGSPDLWIDATDEYARLGQLPAADQGRLALVARAESTGLIVIPEASSQENRIVERREFYLAENGLARIVETTEPRGVFESGYRGTYADADNKDRREGLKEYIGTEYLSEKLTHVERSEPEDLGKPFQLVIEAEKAKRGATDLESAVAAIRLESLFSRLPSELQEREKEEEKGAEDKPDKPRAGDYQLPEAFSYEWQYRIVPPLGFQAKPLPPNVKSSLGPATLSEDFAVENDGAVRATFRFDTVKRRLTATEAKELREKILQIREGPAVLLYFEPIAQALMNQGKMKEAFQATRSVIAQHPKEAVHYLQRAKLLLEGGMGQAAREAARTAVKLEPNSALAQKTLAEILEYDVVGRQYRRGSDLAGAEAAFRAAEKLDPDDKEIAGNLAILLEHNRDGERYGPGAKMKEAVAEYQTLKEGELDKIGLKNNPAYALFYAGDFAGAKKAAEKLNPQLNAVIVACETALHGVSAGMTEAQKRTGNEKDLKPILKAAGEMLMRARKYAPAAELMAAGAEGANASNTMALSAMLRKAQIHEGVKPEDSPRGVVTRMFLNLADPEITLEKMMAIYSRNAQKVMRDTDPEEIEKVLHEGRIMRGAMTRIGFPADIMIDIVFPAMEGQVEGDDNSGYRVTVRPPGSNKVTMWVIREEGRYKILDGSEKPNSVGLEILDRLAAGNLAGARVLLDWVRDEEHLAGGDDPLAGSAFPRMWTKGKEATAEQMKNAAAAILAQTKPTARQGVQILEGARSDAKTDTTKTDLGIALLTGYSNLQEYEKLYALASEMAKQSPESKRLFFDQEIALRALHRYAEADALAQEMGKRLPDDTDIRRAFIYTAVAREDYARAHELGRKLVEDGKAEGQDLNGVAWNALFTGKVSQEDLEAATKSAQVTQNSSAGILHTLGCVYAEMGKTKEAREVLVQAIDLLGMDELDANYWYGFGRIAEQYGETEAASADYQKAKKPKDDLQVPGSSYALAQKRLAAMKSGKQ